MSTRHLVTDLTSQNATETNKTLMGSIVAPVGAKRIIGVSQGLKLTGLTTLESISGIVEVESNAIGTHQFIMPNISPLTSGVSAMNPFYHPCSIPVTPGDTIKCYTTFDMALTAATAGRVGLVFEY